MRTWPPIPGSDIPAVSTTPTTISITTASLLGGDLHLSPAMRRRGSVSSSTASSQAAFQLPASDAVAYSPLARSRSHSHLPSRTNLGPDSLRLQALSDPPATAPVTSRPSSAEQEPTQLFACPYTKFDPVRYSASNLQELNYRGCGQCYLTDISRLKQHLYRVHERPQHFCPTCFTTFKNQERCARHIVLRSCQPQQCPFDEKMSDAQLAVIKKKNRGTNPYICWYDIFSTLFPDAPRPASPYASFTSAATPQSLDLFMQYVQDRAPQRLRQQLGTSLALDERMLTTLEMSIATVLRQLRQEFDVNMQTERGSMPFRHSNTLHPDDGEIRRHNSRKRKAADAALQVPVNFQYTLDAQSLGSVGDVSAPGSFSSTPALVDDDGEHFGRRQLTSPSKRFAVDMEGRDVMHDVLPDQMIRVVSQDMQWQHRETTSPATLFQPEPDEWQMNMMTGTNLTMNMTQPGLNAAAPRQWLEPDENIRWWATNE